MMDSMGSTLALILLLAAAGMAGWLLHRQLLPRLRARRQRRALRRIQQKRLRREAGAAPSFRAVSIVPARPACRLVRRCAHTRYLATEAPRLPLAGCRAAHCRCRYRHHEDRRTEDRRNPFGIDHVSIGVARDRRSGERRSGGGFAAAEMA